MSTRPKAFLKQSRPKKKEQILESADDFQAAGVDFEDAAGKWRAGDPVKSMRFFQRALQVYEQGLQKHPQSFDLAYNKARVQLEVATHPILVKQLQTSTIDALRMALASHQCALNLDHDNADCLFNTSQVLTSIAEEIAKDDNVPDTEALQPLEEALELQTLCLSIQEVKYAENLEQQQAAVDQINNSSVQPSAGIRTERETSYSDAQGEQWVTIVEPVTDDTLIDTILAQLGTLTTFCGMLSSATEFAPPSTLTWLEEYSSKILHGKLPTYATNKPDRLQEIALVKANFISSLLEAGFHAQRIDADTYKHGRDESFSTPDLDLRRSAEALLANSRSLIAFNSALADAPASDLGSFSVTRWNALTVAISNLNTASKLSGTPNDEIAKTHLLRGDCSLLQFRMGLVPVLYQPAIVNGLQLLKNAGVFYRNASKLSSDQEEKAVAAFRSNVAQTLQSGSQNLLATAASEQSEKWGMEQLEDMLAEGLISPDFL